MDYARYLRVKRVVDDRAINLRVLNSLQAHLLAHAPLPTLRVLDVGAGVGSMFSRLHDMHFFATFPSVHYTLVDIKADLLAEARRTISHIESTTESTEPRPAAAAGAATATTEASGSGDAGAARPATARAPSAAEGGIHYESAGASDAGAKELQPLTVGQRYKVSFHVGDAKQYLRDRPDTFDLIIASSVLDLWHPDTDLPPLLAALRARGPGAYYLPITFDGTTDFFPPTSEGATFDAAVEQAFHRAMGRRMHAGHESLAAHTGRRLLPALTALGASGVHAAGASAWIVAPQRGGRYTHDEAYFLHCIVDFVEATARASDKPFCSAVAFARYVACRRRQIDAGELVYVAHNIDVFGAVSPPVSPVPVSAAPPPLAQIVPLENAEPQASLTLL